MKAQTFSKVMIGLILALILAKFIHIEADPWSIKSTSDIHDEAWWAENAKNNYLENKWINDDCAGGLAVSPIINFIYYCSFNLFGISFFSLRIFSVLASILNIILYYFLSKRYLSTQNEALVSTLIFASLPSYFILGRLGSLETGLITFLLLSIILVLQNKAWYAVLAGITLALGIQLKGSFIFVIPVVLILQFTKNTPTQKKDFLIISITAFIVTGLFYLFYYLPNILRFQQYYYLFSSEFYSLQQLFHPAGITIRLAYLYSKETITDPFIFTFIAIIIYRIIFLKFNNQTNKLMHAFFVGFIFTLFSDFNDKRLILLCIVLPILCIGNFNEKKFSINTLRYVAIFCSFSLFSLFPEIKLFHWNVSYLMGISIDSILIFSIFQIIIFTTTFQFEKHSKTLKIATYSYASLVFFFLTKTFSLVLINSLNIPLESIYLTLFTFITIVLVYYLSQKKMIILNNLIAIIAIIQLSYIAFQLTTDSFEIKKLSQYFAQQGNDSDRIIGPNSIFEIAFLGKKHPIYFSKNGKLSPSVSNADIIWFGAITNSEYSELDLKKDLSEAEKNLNMHFQPYYNVKIYKNKYKAFLFKRLAMQSKRLQ